MTRKQRRRFRQRYIQIVRQWRRERTRRSKRTPPESIRPTRLGELLRNYRHLEVWPVKKNVGATDGYIKVPKVFSLIDNPNETMATLEYLRATLANPRIDQVFFDHTDCENLDLDASVIMDVMALRAKKRRHSRNSTFGFSGKYSDTPEVNVLLRAIGLLSSIEHPHSNLPDSVSERFELFKLRVGHKTPPSRTTMIERFAGELAKFFDKCLNKHGYELVSTADLKHLMSEVLDNAEEHARIDPYWQLIAFYRQTEAGSPKGDCHIVIFNLGDTMATSLLRKDTDPELRRRVNDFIRHHKNAGHFGPRSQSGKRWEEDDLLTQLALQEGVSRRWNPGEGSDRGNGTVNMIEFFGSLTSQDRKMTLISGSTKINFSQEHRMVTRNVNGDQRQVIAFNQENSLFDMPDEAAVEHLTERFPGTLISLRFDIDEGDLKLKTEVIREQSQVG